MGKRNIKRISCVISSMVGLLMVGYSTLAASNTTLEDFMPKEQGSVTIENLQIREYSRQVPVHEIQAKHIVFQEKEHSIAVSNLNLTIQDEKGIDSHISSDRALFKTDTKIAEISDNVKYLSRNGGSLVCELLKWDMNKDKIYIPGKFTMVQGNRTLKGSNFLTDRNLTESAMDNIEVIIR